MKDIESQDTLKKKKTGAKNLRSTLNRLKLFLWVKYTYKCAGETISKCPGEENENQRTENN